MGDQRGRVTGSMDVRGRVGARGEDVAAGHLSGLGMRVVERGYRCRLGEVDIIAWDGRALVFCEVKTRRQTRFGPPEEAVTPAKQARIVALAQAYMQDKRLDPDRVRFDVVGVVLVPGASPRVRHTPGAF